MDCNHSNPAGFVFCATCGSPLLHQRCSCGFASAVKAVYCGRCGSSLERESTTGRPALRDHSKYDLKLFAGLAPPVSKPTTEQPNKKKMTQADIKELLKKKVPQT